MEELISLLLDISWLYSVNATISIREFKIEIKNPKMGEKVRAVQGPLLTFSSDHEILMHSVFNYKPPSVREDHGLDSSESENSSESEDDFFDIDDSDFQ